MSRIVDFSKIKDTDRMVIFTERAPKDLVGKKLPIVSGEYYCRYTDKFNLETYELISNGDEKYDECKAMTLNDLAQAGIIEDWKPYRWYDIDNILPSIFDNPNVLHEIDVNALIKKCKDEFAEHGFNVSYTAIRHQLYSWANDLKSGYRDEAGGYFLFTPCGHNDFSMRVSELHPLCAYWQETYEC